MPLDVPTALDPFSLLCLKSRNTVILTQRLNWDCPEITLFLSELLHGKWLPMLFRRSKPSLNLAAICHRDTLAWQIFEQRTSDYIPVTCRQCDQRAKVAVDRTHTLCSGTHSSRMGDGWIDLRALGAEGEVQTFTEFSREIKAHFKGQCTMTRYGGWRAIHPDELQRHYIL